MRRYIKNRLDASTADPSLRRALNLYRQTILYPIRRRRNFVLNVYHYRLVSTGLRGIRRHGWRLRATIGFTPDQPNQTSQIYRIMLMNRYRWVDPTVTRPDITLYWAYGATDKPPTTEWEPEINARCRDITKCHVDVVHRKVFGYGLEVDPFTHQGEAFVKSDANALHDGHIEQLPIATPTPGMVYQRLVDNKLADGTREDIRVPVVFGTIPFVFLVHRCLGDHIGERIMGASRLTPVDEVFSSDEVVRILNLCHALGLELGELDVLRDNGNDQIYVVDVNRAVGSFVQPGEMTSQNQYWTQLTTVADLFDATFGS